MTLVKCLKEVMMQKSLVILQEVLEIAKLKWKD